MASEHTLAEPQLKVTPQCIPTPPNQCLYQVSTFYILWNSRNSLDTILKLMVTMARSNVKSRSHHHTVHLHSQTNVPTKYQLPTPYGFRDIAQTTFYRSRYYGKVKSRPHHNVAHLHPLTNVPTKYQLPTPYGSEI